MLRELLTTSCVSTDIPAAAAALYNNNNNSRVSLLTRGGNSLKSWPAGLQLR
jgi:hypothetical protein